jgi:hypothetical protein
MTTVAMPNLDFKQVASQAYAETGQLMRDPEMASVVTHGLNILYGPPMLQPDLAIITFQGGGADNTLQTSWPQRLLYLDDEFPFGTKLREYSECAGLSPILQRSTVAIAAVFPQAPQSEASTWMASTGPKARWREFSVEWTKRLLLVQAPRVILVYGTKASEALNFHWLDIERKHKQNHMTFGRAIWNDIPAIFSRHLSSGCGRESAVNCLREVKKLLTKSSRAQ